MLYIVLKKKFTVKNTLISTTNKLIVFLGLTTQGSFHDYALLKEELPPDNAWFEQQSVWVDLGYLGFQKDYLPTVNIPYKKPRKSTKNPEPKLTSEQKAHNKAVNKVRVIVENAIAGMKRYFILSNRFRNKKEGFDDDVMAIAAGLWNLKVK